MNSGAGLCVQHCEGHRLQKGGLLSGLDGAGHGQSMCWSSRGNDVPGRGALSQCLDLLLINSTVSPRPVHCGWHHLRREPDLPQAPWWGAHAELHLLWPGPGEMEVWSCWWVTSCPHLPHTLCGSVQTGCSMEKLVCEFGPSLCPLFVLNCTKPKIKAALHLLEGKWKGIC